MNVRSPKLTSEREGIEMGDESIGMFYKLLGTLLAVGAVVLVGFGISHNHEFGKIDGLLIGGMLVGAIALVRPQWLDSLIKTVADKLPFLAYQKPKDGSDA